MAYGEVALECLHDWIGNLFPFAGKILELRNQDTNHDVSLEKIIQLLSKIHRGNIITYRDIVQKYFSAKTQTGKVANSFRESKFHYNAMDLYPDEFIIHADLNLFHVPAHDHNRERQRKIKILKYYFRSVMICISGHKIITS